MRNWLLRRKGGGGENASNDCPVAGTAIEALAGEASSAVAATAALAVFPSGAVIAVRSRLCAASGLESLQCSAQQGMEACIAAILLPGFATQHIPTAGTAVAKTSSETTTAVANRVVIDVMRGITIGRTSSLFFVFHRKPRAKVSTKCRTTLGWLLRNGAGGNRHAT
jgi:hypothetical protein